MTRPIDGIIASITERIRTTARVETIIGEARAVDGRTVIPVARLAYGFGAGAGENPVSPEAEAPRPGGGGGGVSLSPVGFLILSPEGERFVPVRARRREVAGAFLAGALLGWALAKRASAQRPK